MTNLLEYILEYQIEYLVSCITRPKDETKYTFASYFGRDRFSFNSVSNNCNYYCQSTHNTYNP